MVAITIPFDVRDLGIDGGLKTIPQLIGAQQAYNLSYLLFFVGWCCVGLAYFAGAGELLGLSLDWLLAIGVINLLTFTLVKLSRGKTSDYYFSGLLDGALILRGLILWAVIFLN